MPMPTTIALEQAFKKCSDCGLHPDYTEYLRQLESGALTDEHIAYLCEKCCSKKHIWEIRFSHLRILLINPTARNYDLKAFFAERVKATRRLCLKLFYIRGYAMYATEAELEPVMKKFCASLEKNHDYIDYNDILSVAGLPYLVDTYGYACFRRAYQVAKEEASKISLLMGGYTLDGNLKQISLLSNQKIARRTELFLKSKQ